MVVSGTNSGAFCKDFGSVVLSELTDRISVNYTLTLPDGSSNSFSEHYSPNDKGVVRINDLGELAFVFFEPLPMVLSGPQSVNQTLLIEASVYDPFGNFIGQFSQKFFYANCRTNLRSPHSFLGFLSRHHRRTISTDQAHFIGFIQNGQQLGVGVSYRKNDTQQWTEFLLDTSDNGQIYYHNLDVLSVSQYLQANTGEFVSAEDIFYYIIYLKANGEVQDAMQVDVDRTPYPYATHMVYYNGFGIPDSLRFTGRDFRSSDFDASYVNVQHNFLKINTKYRIFHDVNTGYINGGMRDCFEDLVNSDAPVYLYNNWVLGDRITITEVNFDDSTPRTEPINARIKYRLSAECQHSIDRDMTVDYRIFDHTFGEEFE